MSEPPSKLQAHVGLYRLNRLQQFVDRKCVGFKYICVSERDCQFYTNYSGKGFRAFNRCDRRTCRWSRSLVYPDWTILLDLRTEGETAEGSHCC